MSNTKRDIIHDSVVESRSSRGRRLLVALVVLSLAMLVVAAVASAGVYRSLHTSASQGVTLAQQVKQACKAPGHQTKEIRNLCSKADRVIDTSPVAPASPGPTGPAGATGPGPTDAQVAVAVARFCRDNGCTGPQGPSPTAGQVAQAVALYCNARGDCKGPQGAQGAQGAQGVPGDNATGAPGPQGPPPTSDQVSDAVNTYCADHNNCQGPQGPQGDPGPTGVVDVDASGCSQHDGQVIESVSASYDADTRKIVLACTYASPIIPPGQ